MGAPCAKPQRSPVTRLIALAGSELLGHQRGTEQVLQLRVMMWMQVVRGRLEAEAGTAKAKPIDKSTECLEGIRGLGATPADHLIGQ